MGTLTKGNKLITTDITKHHRGHRARKGLMGTLTKGNKLITTDITKHHRGHRAEKGLMATLSKRQMTDNQPHNKTPPWTSGRKRADGTSAEKGPMDTLTKGK